MDVTSFRPLRARYVQRMYDLDGAEQVQSRTIVHLEVERVIHSGRWTGVSPVTLDPFREPGLLITWKVQNGLYNAFDRVLTDRNLSMRERMMPAGIGGLRIGSLQGGEYVQVRAARPDSTDEFDVRRVVMAEGGVNVLSLPYVLAGMDLKLGERFTLPGYAMIGGPSGEGTPWQAALYVRSKGTTDVKGAETEFYEVLLMRLDDRNGLSLDDVDFGTPARRFTRLIVSPDPPYLLGRADQMGTAEGGTVLVREFLGLADWAPILLPMSDFIAEELYDFDLENGVFDLKEATTPPLLGPLGNGPPF